MKEGTDRAASANEPIAVQAILGTELNHVFREIPEVTVLNADTATSCGLGEFFRENPYAVQVGVAEQNMMLMAAGLASTGRVPIVTTFAVFASLRACECVRTSIAYPKANVKILVSHAGISPAEDGVTHMCTEDLAVMRSMPNMTVVAPADAYATIILLREALKIEGPVYIRFSKSKEPLVYERNAELSIGKAHILREGKDLTIVACGPMVARTLQTATLLEKKGIECTVLDVHTIKPLDQQSLLRYAEKTGAVVCAEDHNVLGGLGGAVSELLGSHCPVPIERIGVPDQFAESGSYGKLIEKYGMDATAIYKAALRCFERKRTVS